MLKPTTKHHHQQHTLHVIRGVVPELTFLGIIPMPTAPGVILEEAEAEAEPEAEAEAEEVGLPAPPLPRSVSCGSPWSTDVAPALALVRPPDSTISKFQRWSNLTKLQ